MSPAQKKSLIFSLALLALSLLFIFLLKLNLFSNINSEVSVALGATLNLLPYKISKYTGLLVFLIPLAFAALGLLTLVKTKSLKQVPRELYCLLGLYLATLLVYLFFELFPLNFRPIDLGAGPEPSFPSSHTLFSVVICVSAALLFEKCHFLFAPVKDFLPFLKILSYFLAALVVVSRLLSGVHWFTDILGGLLISATLLSFFSFSLTLAQPPTKSKKPTSR